MDVEFWLYVVIGVVYFLSRLLKKGEQATSEAPKPQRRERPKPARPVPTPASREAERPMTFEDLLREIMEGKQAQRRPEPVKTYQTEEREADDEAQSLEEVGIDEVQRAPRWKPYEEVPDRAFERQSLEETLHLEDTVVEFKKFEPFQQREEKRLSEEYIKIIRNPESLRQAVVMSEILKRKF